LFQAGPYRWFKLKTLSTYQTLCWRNKGSFQPGDDLIKTFV
jgi:hypothetical protein